MTFLVGSYNCGCESGYQKESGTTCIDINECADDPCVENEVCINNLGSYICMCKEGYQKTRDHFCQIFLADVVDLEICSSSWKRPIQVREFQL